ncbi:MAG: TIGR04282 family arsenosugar biosynthesis glycosyltransferase [Flavobacteriales bacterium]|nr:TIGR04282 family arsenosugar biosynthesis glycosyltransferase [Flavobacteriales bacterium]
MKKALILFTKNPEAGKVKTRLAATIGNEAALKVYNQLLLYTVSATEYLPVDMFVFYSDHIPQDDIFSNKNYIKEMQQGMDLGERMKNAFASTFERGYAEIVIIGADCPDISSAIIMNAFDDLNNNDVVIGPAEDGGYYLLGLKALHTELFEDIEWSTEKVLHHTITKCKASKHIYHLLPVLNDIDVEKDLVHLNKNAI